MAIHIRESDVFPCRFFFMLITDPKCKKGGSYTESIIHCPPESDGMNLIAGADNFREQHSARTIENQHTAERLRNNSIKEDFLHEHRWQDTDA